MFGAMFGVRFWMEQLRIFADAQAFLWVELNWSSHIFVDVSGRSGANHATHRYGRSDSFALRTCIFEQRAWLDWFDWNGKRKLRPLGVHRHKFWIRLMIAIKHTVREDCKVFRSCISRSCNHDMFSVVALAILECNATAAFFSRGRSFRHSATFPSVRQPLLQVFFIFT